MVRILAIHEIDVDGGAASINKGPEKLLNDLCVKTPGGFTLKVDVIDKKRSVRKIDHDRGQGLDEATMLDDRITKVRSTKGIL